MDRALEFFSASVSFEPGGLSGRSSKLFLFAELGFFVLKEIQGRTHANASQNLFSLMKKKRDTFPRENRNSMFVFSLLYFCLNILHVAQEIKWHIFCHFATFWDPLSKQ